MPTLPPPRAARQAARARETGKDDKKDDNGGLILLGALGLGGVGLWLLLRNQCPVHGASKVNGICSCPAGQAPAPDGKGGQVCAAITPTPTPTPTPTGTAAICASLGLPYLPNGGERGGEGCGYVIQGGDNLYNLAETLYCARPAGDATPCRFGAGQNLVDQLIMDDNCHTIEAAAAAHGCPGQGTCPAGPNACGSTPCACGNGHWIFPGTQIFLRKLGVGLPGPLG